MDTIVLRLQSAAEDPTTSVTALLLKAKSVATKLGLDDDLVWIRDELEGYSDLASLPDYRRVGSRVQAFNPYHGWQPVRFGNAEIEHIFCTQHMFEAVSVLIELVSRCNASENGSITKLVPPAGLDMIYKYMPVPLKVLAFIDPSALTHIVESVRARILGWALSLERKGILGENMTLSNSEKRQDAESAQVINVGNITNFAGSLGGTVTRQTITATQTSTGTFTSRVSDFLDSLEETLHDLPDEETAEIVAAAKAVKAEADQPEPDESRMKKALRAVGAATLSLGNYATQAAITDAIGKLMGAQ